MGCDIHIVIQRQDDDGAWREAAWQEAPFTFAGARLAVDGVPVAPEVFRQRNYALFAILANVRNGVGFAGIRTGDGWPSIAPERGWPDGFDERHVLPNPQYPEDGPRDMGDHSFTWVSLDELRTFPWDATVTSLCGVVEAAQYEVLTAVGDAPDSYCGDISGPGIIVYDPPGYLTAKREGRLALNPYVRMSWHESARSATHNWPGTVIPWLEGLAD